MDARPYHLQETMAALQSPEIHSTIGAAWRRRLAALGALGFLCPALSSAATWNIYEDGSGDARTIQDAMAKAAAGDTVLVWPGTYLDPIQMTSDVSLISQAGAATTILDADGAIVAIDAGQTAPVTGVLVQGFTITGVRYGGLFDVARTIDVDGDAVVRDCIISGNFAIVAGAHLRRGDLRIYDTLFENNRGGRSAPWVAGVSCRRGYVIVERCTFDTLTYGLSLRVEEGDVEFRDNVLRDCVEPIEILAGVSSVLIYDNLFDGIPHPITVSGGPSVIIRRNTFARAGPTGAALGPGIGENTIIDRNVFTGAYWGLWVCSICTGVTVTCNDSWDNTINWLGHDGGGDNFSLDPLYCDPAGGDFTVAENSPLLGHNSPCGDQVGAFGVGCPPMSVEASSWGAIKGRYR
jgi:hypothetical protein